LSVIFVDVRGSTALAEGISSARFSKTLNHFYAVASEVLVKTDAFIDKFVGDEAMGVYLPVFAGKNYAAQATKAAMDILSRPYAVNEEELSIDVGVHTGPAFFGTVMGATGVFSDFTALGDTVNVAARLVSAAAPGEALISDATLAAAGIEASGLEHRQIDLKGKSEPVNVRVFKGARDGNVGIVGPP
jgi:adenylate cyclase